MNRSDFVKISSIGITGLLLSYSCKKKSNHISISNFKSIKKFTGKFDYNIAKNFLSRTTLNYNTDDINQSLNLGLEKTVEFILRELPESKDLPINFEYLNDKYTPLGKTWMFSPMSKKYNFEHYRKKSFESWLTKKIYSDKFSMVGQMMLFWHNMFPVGDIMEHKYNYVHFMLCRKYALGNYKNLLYDMTIDTSMLTYLNGNQNNKYAPNENYARELLELFTIGMGEQVKEGDYTYYTEYDIHQISKALTGWEDFSVNTTYLKGPKPSNFIFAKHDNSSIKLSDKFNNVKIPMDFSKRYKHVIDIILEKEQTAINVVQKLYRWFVNYEIDSIIKNEIIYPLANIFIQNNYDIKPVLKSLFLSEHFINIISHRPKIKNPIEFTNSILSNLDFNFEKYDIKNIMNFWHEVYKCNSVLGMDLLRFPTVAGLKEYYHNPTYYKLWLNAATLKARRIFVQKILFDGFEETNVKINVVKLINKVNKENSLELVKNILSLYFNSTLSYKRIDYLENELLNNISKTKFNSYLYLYLRNKIKSNSDEYKILDRNLKNLLYKIFTLPEFNLL